MKTYSEKKQDWLIWHKENPKFWELFQKFSLEAIKNGRSKISHWLVTNRIRWEESIVTTGSEFKISNDYIAFYARLWKETYPEHAELFNTKKMIGEV